MKTLCAIGIALTLALTVAMVREDRAWWTQYRAQCFGHELAYTIASITRR